MIQAKLSGRIPLCVIVVLVGSPLFEGAALAQTLEQATSSPPSVVYASRKFDSTVEQDRADRRLAVDRAERGRLMLLHPTGGRTTLIDAEKGIPRDEGDLPIDISDPSVQASGMRIVFSGFNEAENGWRIYSIDKDGRDLRQITQSDRQLDLSKHGDAAELLEGYDDLDPCYLPDGRICFVSTRYPGLAPNGRVRATNLYVVQEDGSGMRRITTERFGADTPAVDPKTGKIVYSRWWMHAEKNVGIAPFQSEFNDAVLRGVSDENYEGVNTWSLAEIKPDGTELKMFLGSGLNRALTIAYRPSFSRYGESFWMSISNSPLLGRAGDHGLRTGPRGAIGAISSGDPTAVPPAPAVQYYQSPAPPINGFTYSSAEVLGSGDLLITAFAPDRTSYDIFVQVRTSEPTETPARFSRPVFVGGEEGWSDLDAVPLIQNTTNIPNHGSFATAIENDETPSTAEEAAELNGTFRFVVENIFTNAPVDALIANAPPIGESLWIEFYMNPQRGGVTEFEEPILLDRQLVPSDGRVEATLPAGVPLFEVLRRPNGDIAVGRDGAAFHVGGMNFGVAGEEAKCVGCHVGHSLLDVSRDPSWTNVATSAQVKASHGVHLLPSNFLVDRTAFAAAAWSPNVEADESPARVEARWETSIEARELVLHPARRGSTSFTKVTASFFRGEREVNSVQLSRAFAGPETVRLASLETFDRMELLVEPVGPASRAVRLSEIEVLGRAAPIGHDVSIGRLGDANCDQTINLGDVVGTLNYMFLGGAPLCCAAAADSNQDGWLHLSDAVMTLSWLYQGGPAPAGDSAGLCQELASGTLSCPPTTCQ